MLFRSLDRADMDLNSTGKLHGKVTREREGGRQGGREAGRQGRKERQGAGRDTNQDDIGGDTCGHRKVSALCRTCHHTSEG